MQVKASAKQYTITLEKRPQASFAVAVGNIFAHEDDFNAATGLFSVIRVDYAPGYYANPRFLTSKDLRALMQAYRRAAEAVYFVCLCEADE